MVDGKGDISVNNEKFLIGEEYIREYVWVTIDIGEQSLVVFYKDEKMSVHKFIKLITGLRKKYTIP